MHTNSNFRSSMALQPAQALPRLSFRLLKAMPAMAPSSKPHKGTAAIKQSFYGHCQATLSKSVQSLTSSLPVTSESMACWSTSHEPQQPSTQEAKLCTHLLARPLRHVAVQCMSLGLVSFLFRLLLLFLPFGLLCAPFWSGVSVVLHRLDPLLFFSCLLQEGRGNSKGTCQADPTVQDPLVTSDIMMLSLPAVPASKRKRN